MILLRRTVTHFVCTLWPIRTKTQGHEQFKMQGRRGFISCEAVWRFVRLSHIVRTRIVNCTIIPATPKSIEQALVVFPGDDGTSQKRGRCDNRLRARKDEYKVYCFRSFSHDSL